MTTLEVFDPAMCCSTGVCGPQVDPRLAAFESDLRWLGAQGVAVSRYNLGQDPGAFAGNDLVRTLLHSGGEEALPVILVEGRLRWSGQYPTRNELAAGVGVTAAQACCTPADQVDGGCRDQSEPMQIGSAPDSGGCC